MTFTDTHCHLNFKSFSADLEAVIERAWENEVEKILVPGTDIESSRKALELSDRYDNIFAAVGIHPNDSLLWDGKAQDELAGLAKHPKVRAIGEIGLDYYRDRAPREHQINIYKEQLALASIMNLPVIIHCREAMQDILDISFGWLDGLQKNGHPLARNPGVFHAFDGDLATAVRICERGFFIGIGGPVTYRNAQNRHDLATVIPLENMVLETDAPFLAPQPHRGERNEPSYLKHIAVMVAGLRKIDCQKISQMTGQNAERLLGWRAGI